MHFRSFHSSPRLRSGPRERSPRTTRRSSSGVKLGATAGVRSEARHIRLIVSTEQGERQGAGRVVLARLQRHRDQPAPRIPGPHPARSAR